MIFDSIGEYACLSSFRYNAIFLKIINEITCGRINQISRYHYTRSLVGYLIGSCIVIIVSCNN